MCCAEPLNAPSNDDCGRQIRAVENIDLDKLKYRHVDGFSRGPPYEVF
jgi:hypothetical protein